MSTKTLAVISYITLIGWLVAFLSRKDKSNTFLNYHLRQAFGLLITMLIFNVTISIVILLIPSLDFLSYLSYGFLGLLIAGIINANKELEQPIPLIGKMFENKFAFVG